MLCGVERGVALFEVKSSWGSRSPEVELPANPVPMYNAPRYPRSSSCHVAPPLLTLTSTVPPNPRPIEILLLNRIAEIHRSRRERHVHPERCHQCHDKDLSPVYLIWGQSGRQQISCEERRHCHHHDPGRTDTAEEEASRHCGHASHWNQGTGVGTSQEDRSTAKPLEDPPECRRGYEWVGRRCDFQVEEHGDQEYAKYKADDNVWRAPSDDRRLLLLPDQVLRYKL
ncbi:hypothetical protein KC354_g141 [Hortaea werneckii]|nr:hypothetical protein KC354_g141 [Hortaea werneckii]